MEFKLSDNSNVSLTWLTDNRLKLELYQPRTLRDGHGMLLRGSAILSEADISALVALITSPAERKDVKELL